MNPYKTIWFKPSETFDFFANEDEKKSFFYIPILIMGLVMGLDQAPEVSNVLAEEFVWWSLLVTIPISIFMAFLIFVGIMPWLIRLVGRIWNGSATERQMTNVIAISTIPYGCILVYQILKLLVEQNPAMDNLNPGINFILSTWTLGLLIFGVSKAQKLSYKLALLNIALAYLPLFLLGMLVG